MASKETIHHRVAAALLDLAREEGKVADYQTTLASIRRDFKKEPRFKEILGSYRIPFEELYGIVDKVYGGSPLKHLTAFLKYLVTKRLMPEFDGIYEEFITLSDDDLGILEGIVYSVVPLSEGELEELNAAFEPLVKKKVRLSNRTEPSLIGGIRVFLDGKAYDGSLSNKIEALRERLLSATKKGETRP